jgi:hypothetical protein
MFFLQKVPKLACRGEGMGGWVLVLFIFHGSGQWALLFIFAFQILPCYQKPKLKTLYRGCFPTLDASSFSRLHCHAEVAASSLLSCRSHRLLPPSRKSCRVLLPSDPPPSLPQPPSLRSTAFPQIHLTQTWAMMWGTPTGVATVTQARCSAWRRTSTTSTRTCSGSSPISVRAEHTIELCGNGDLELTELQHRWEVSAQPESRISARQELVDWVITVNAPPMVFDFTTKGHCRHRRIFQ